MKLFSLCLFALLFVSGCKKDDPEEFDVKFSISAPFKDGRVTVWQLNTSPTSMISEAVLDSIAPTEITISKVRSGNSYKVYITRNTPDSTSVATISCEYLSKKIAISAPLKRVVYRSENFIKVE
jgi:hypothetical protein